MTACDTQRSLRSPLGCCHVSHGVSSCWSELPLLEMTSTTSSRRSLRCLTPCCPTLFGGPLLFAVVLAASGWAVGIALTAALRDDVNTRPLAIISLAIPCVVYFWFVEPFGFAHAGFTLMVVGYAVSREMRRMYASIVYELPLTDARPGSRLQKSAVLLSPISFQRGWMHY